MLVDLTEVLVISSLHPFYFGFSYLVRNDVFLLSIRSKVFHGPHGYGIDLYDKTFFFFLIVGNSRQCYVFDFFNNFYVIILM